MNPLEKDKLFKLLKVIDIENPNQNGNLVTFRTSAQTTVADLLIYLKREIGKTFNYYLILQNGQTYSGKENEKLWNLLENKQMDIKYQKKLNNQIDLLQQLSAHQQPHPQNFEKSRNIMISQQNESRIKSIREVDQKQFQGTIEQIRPASRMDKNLRGNNQMVQIGNNFFYKTNPLQNQEHSGGPVVKQSMFDINQSNLQLLLNRIQHLEESVSQIDEKVNLNHLNILEQLRNNEIKRKSQEKIELEKLIDDKNIILIQNIQQIQQEYLYKNQDFNDFRKKIEKAIENLQIKSKLEQKQILDYQGQQLDVQLQNSIKNQVLETSQISQNLQKIEQNSVMNTQLMTETQVFIKLSCHHQVEKAQLEKIIQNTIISGTIATCETCKTPISNQICRQLGNLGDQYLQIKNENNLQSLFQNILLQKGPQEVIVCSIKNCNFFCIINPLISQTYGNYCPKCLINSVINQNVQQYKKARIVKLK